MPLALATVCVASLLLAAPARADVTADFTWAPERPLTGQRVTFHSTSSAAPAGNAIASWAWNFDGDPSPEDTGPVGVWTFAAPGDHLVRLHVVDITGAEADKTVRVEVGNRRPNASIAFSPAAPRAGDLVTFFSTSDDDDGYIRGSSWDLDGDGKYDDGNGVLATASFAGPGTYKIGLKVSDNLGATDTGTALVTVGMPADNALVSLQVPGQANVTARLLTPFPIVRVSGLVRRHGIRLRVLSVSAPLGSTVSVSCKGRGCPFRRKSRYVTADSRAATLPGAKLVRLSGLGRRLLRTGATMQVFVTRLGEVGKYTRLKVRKGKLPARVDRCLIPDSKQPVVCPPG